jgi:hypothetical protein
LLQLNQKVILVSVLFEKGKPQKGTPEKNGEGGGGEKETNDGINKSWRMKMKEERKERMCMWKDMNRCNINVQYKTVNTGCWLAWGG